MSCTCGRWTAPAEMELSFYSAHSAADEGRRFWYDSNGWRLNSRPQGKQRGFPYVRWFLDLSGERGGTSHCPSTFPIYHSQGTGKLLVGLISRSVELLLCAVEYKLHSKPPPANPLCFINKTCKMLSVLTWHVWFGNQMQEKNNIP